MEHAAQRENYVKRLTRVIAHIYDHLDEDLDLQRLADVACLSPYHWHRIYHALYGETVAATIKRLRLQRAARDLQTSMRIEEVAARSGYASVPAFTRAFKTVFGLPPAQYKVSGSHMQFAQPAQDGAPAAGEVVIKDVPPMRIATIGHVGPYMQIGRAFDTLFGTLAARNQIRPGIRTIGIFLDDPTARPEGELRSQAGVIVEAGQPIEAPLAKAAIIGGPYAVLRYQGPYSNMHAAYDWLFGNWLVGSGRDAADAPVFEEYLNNPRGTAPTELLTDIYLPLR
jgi:AraC family transcriptional regulator